MLVRKAKAEDAAPIAALAAVVWIHTYAREGIRQEFTDYVSNTFSVAQIEKNLRHKVVWVVENNGHLAAYGALNPDSSPAEIETLYVLPRFQGQGVGRLLLEAIVAEYASVELTVWDENSRAIAFYEAFGFRKVGESFFELNENERYRNFRLAYGD